MKAKAEKIISCFYSTGNRVVKVVGCMVFLLLTWYAFRYTYFMVPGEAEIPINTKDSMLWNILGLLAAIGLYVLLRAVEKRTTLRVHSVLRKVTLLAAMLWVGAASFWWILSADRIPEGDQAYIYAGASYFMEGNYDYLSGPGAYCGLYPYQLGLIALVELLFTVAGAYNYYAFEYLCAVLAAGIVYLGYRILSELTDCTAAVVAYNLLISGCLPLIFYTPWVYGEIPSIFCILLAGWMLLCYGKREKKRCLVLAACAMVFAMLVRKHSLIPMVAFGIAAILHALKQKDWKIVMAFLLTVALSYGTYQGIYKMYEIRSGYEHSEGIPIIAWFAMGMQESRGRFGWYNNYPKQIVFDQNFDRDLIVETAEENLRDRLQYFRKNPDYAKLFFREKILSQWNLPLYQSVYFNTNYVPGLEPEENSLAARLSGDLYTGVVFFSDRVQFIVYFGMLCYFCFAVRRDSSILQHVLAVTMIGGFLFSIAYEAMSRYIFPYYVMMFPLAVYGIEQAIQTTGTVLRKAYRYFCHGNTAK